MVPWSVYGSEKSLAFRLIYQFCKKYLIANDLFLHCTSSRSLPILTTKSSGFSVNLVQSKRQFFIYLMCLYKTINTDNPRIAIQFPYPQDILLLFHPWSALPLHSPIHLSGSIVARCVYCRWDWNFLFMNIMHYYKKSVVIKMCEWMKEKNKKSNVKPTSPFAEHLSACKNNSTFRDPSCDIQSENWYT